MVFWRPKAPQASSLMKDFITYLLLFLFHCTSYANQNSNELWFGTFTKAPITTNYSIWAEAQIRHDINQNETKQSLIRTGLIKKLSNNSELAALYAYIGTNGLGEHRLALQHAMNYGLFLRSLVSHRIRLEARKFENIDTTNSRVRYLVRLNFKTTDSFKPTLWNEIFINIKREEQTGNQYFDRNRFFLGFRKKLKNQKNHIEFGYLNQYISRSSLDSFEHVLILYLFL